MERLTERYIPNDEKKGIAGIKVFESENKIPLAKVLSGEYLYPAIEKLATYEDLEEQGLLVRLPCKVGEDVYKVNSYVGCDNDKCDDLYSSVHCFNCKFEKEFYYIQKIKFNFDNLDDVGRTIFITKEEAEKKLEEMRNV